MSAKRAASGPRPNRKRLAAAAARTTGEISSERRDRLQMLSLVPDDVLRMVATFVCPPDAPPTQRCKASANFLVLGAPFVGDMFSPQGSVCLARALAQDMRDTLDFAMAIRKWLPPPACVSVCTALRFGFGTTFATRNPRALITAVLHPTRTNADLARCNPHHRIVCALVCNDKTTIDHMIHGGHGVLGVAIWARLWQQVMDLTEWPYNLQAHAPDIHDVIDHHAPSATVHRLIDTAPVSEREHLCIALINSGSGEHMPYLLDKYAGDIRGDEVLADVCWLPLRAEKHSGTVALAAQVIQRIETSVTERTSMLALALRNPDTMQPISDVLWTMEYGTTRLIVELLRGGGFCAAEQMLAKINDKGVMRSVMKDYTPLHPSEFAQDLAAMRRLPVVLSVLDSLPVLDDAIERCWLPMSVEDYKEARRMGMRLHAARDTLTRVMLKAWTPIAQIIVEELSDEDITQAVISVLNKTNDISDIRPALETGRVDVVALLPVVAICAAPISVCRQITEHYAAKK